MFSFYVKHYFVLNWVENSKTKRTFEMKALMCSCRMFENNWYLFFASKIGKIMKFPLDLADQDCQVKD